LIDVPLHVLIGTAAPFSRTTLFPCVAPKPGPEITTVRPTDPVVAETAVITGAGADAELTDTLSNVAVATADALPLFTANPTYTFCPMLIAWLPRCTQVTPSEDV